jgi:hypothetical protein
MNKKSEKYKYCNHHHELTDKHKVVNFGDGKFVANVEAIPLLKALNEIGLKTRTHHISSDSESSFVSILLDNAQVEVREVFERDAGRDRYNGKQEMLIWWKKTPTLASD